VFAVSWLSVTETGTFAPVPDGWFQAVGVVDVPPVGPYITVYRTLSPFEVSVPLSWTPS